MSTNDPPLTDEESGYFDGPSDFSFGRMADGMIAFVEDGVVLETFEPSDARALMWQLRDVLDNTNGDQS